MSKIFKAVKGAIAASAIALLSLPAHALLISGVEVGSLDTVIGAVDSANSSTAQEELYLEGILGFDVSLVANIDTPTGSPNADVNGNRYIDVDPATPGYYVLKFGNGNDPIDMIFMRNELFLRYLAWSDADMITWGISPNHVQSLSHYAITSSSGGSSSTSSSGIASSSSSSSGNVPEPNTSGMALLGLGLLAGSFLVRRNTRRG